MPTQNKSLEVHRNILKSNGKDDEEQENAKENPTFDEYHNMKEKEEDDDGKPKSTNGSSHSKDFPVHVELEHQPDGSSFQLMQVREVAGPIGILPAYRLIICLALFQSEFPFHIGGF